MAKNIMMYCSCGEVYTSERPEVIPKGAVVLGCNWCMECEKENSDEDTDIMHYWLYPEDLEKEEPVDPRQLNLFV